MLRLINLRVRRLLDLCLKLDQQPGNDRIVKSKGTGVEIINKGGK